jgi:PAS domain S-box-containing protein
MTGNDGDGLERSNARLRCLASAMERIQAAGSRDAVMGAVRDAASLLCGADGVSIVMREGDRCNYVDERAIAPLWRGQSFPMNSCVSGWAMLHGRTAVVPDVHEDVRTPSRIYQPTFVKSLVTVPIGQDAPDAAIGVYWAERRDPEDEEVAALEALARAAATALRAIGLLESLKAAKDKAQRAHATALAELAEREKAEMALRASEARFRALGEAIPQLIWTSRDGGDWTWASRQWLAYTGQRGDEPLALGWLESVHADDRSATMEAWSQAPGRGILEVDHRLRRSDGTYRWFQTRALPIHGTGDGPALWCGACTDVSAFKEAEDTLRSARDEAEKANRAKSHFLASASHDLRQPVTAAFLYMDVLSRRLTDPGDIEMADRVRLSLDGLRGLLDGLLEIARLEAGVVRPNPAAFGLEELFRRLSGEFEGQARVTLLRLRVPATHAAVLTDRVMLEIVLRNLMGNALKFTDRGGVSVEATEEPEGGEHGGMVRIDVHDSGRGIPPDQLDRIFDDYYQVGDLTAPAAGFGIGLATVRRIADMLGYRISVNSRMGHGSIFSVWVPSAPTAARLETPEATPATPVSAHRQSSVLMVEDDPIIAAALQLEMRDWGLDVTKVSSLKELRARVGADAFDLVISDYRLGDGDGFEAIAEIRGRAVIPAILLTGDTAPDVILRAERDGIRLLNKPLTGADLKRAIDEALSVD